VSWVLEWGARVKVIEPAELIDRVRTELAGALALYPVEKPAKPEKKTKSR
jgi:predicted DNA-binding transcriptional regulator YafY